MRLRSQILNDVYEKLIDIKAGQKLIEEVRELRDSEWASHVSEVRQEEELIVSDILHSIAYRQAGGSVSDVLLNEMAGRLVNMRNQ